MSSDCDHVVQRLRTEVWGDARPHEIDKLIIELHEKCGSDVIGTMLLSLRDDPPHYEGMFSLIHAAESFPIESYISHLVSALPQLRTTAPDWASVVLMRSLNSDGARALLVRNVRDASEQVKKAASAICNDIVQTSPEFLQKTVAVTVASE